MSIKDSVRRTKDGDKPNAKTTSIVTDQLMAEMVIGADKKPKFAIYRDGRVAYDSVVVVDNVAYEPFNSSNSLIKNEAILFPTEAAEYGTNQGLFAEIVAYLKRWVELPGRFYAVAAAYIMSTWLYERFSEVAYLRITGDTGVGKTRFIKTVGRTCYKAIMASGSATTSSLFRIIDTFRGTFVFDEADFFDSEMHSEIMKILNSGHTKDSYVYRVEKVGKDGEFSVRAFMVFGPKVIASRMRYKDEAMESRCLSEEMMPRQKLSVPGHLGDEFKREAQAIMNKLLTFRFRNYRSVEYYTPQENSKLEPRTMQTAFSVLGTLRTIGDERALADVLAFLDEHNERLKADRGNSEKVDVLLCIAKLMFNEACNGETDLHSIRRSRGVKVNTVAAMFNGNFAEKYGLGNVAYPAGRTAYSPKKVGDIMRNELHLRTRRQKGGYHMPLSERTKVEGLMERYGITADDWSDIVCGEHHPLSDGEVQEVHEVVEQDENGGLGSTL